MTTHQEKVIQALHILATKIDQQDEAHDKLQDTVIQLMDCVAAAFTDHAEKIVSLQTEIEIANKKIAVITKIAKDALYGTTASKKDGEATQQPHQPCVDNSKAPNTTSHAQNEKEFELSTSALFLIGVQQLKQFHGQHPHADPSVVVGETLGLLHLPAMVKVIPADLKNVRTRSASNVVIVYMRNERTKQEAIKAIKTMVRANRMELRKVEAKDAFHPSRISEMRTLEQKGLQLRRTKQIAKFQIINRGGCPILQTGTTGHSKFEDHTSDHTSDFHSASTPSLSPPSVVDWPATSGACPAVPAVIPPPTIALKSG